MLLVLIPMVILPVAVVASISFHYLEKSTSEVILRQLSASLILNRTVLEKEIETIRSKTNLLKKDSLIREYLQFSGGKKALLQRPVMRLMTQYANSSESISRIELINGNSEIELTTKRFGNKDELIDRAGIMGKLAMSSSDTTNSLYQIGDEVGIVYLDKINISSGAGASKAEQPAVLATYYRFQPFIDNLSTFSLPFDSKVLLVDQVGRVLHPAFVSRSPPAVGYDNGEYYNVELKGETYFLAAQKITDELYLSLFVPKREVVNNSLELGYTVVLASCAMLFLAILILNYHLQLVLIKPIRKLMGLTVDIREGNLNKVVTIDSSDEIGALAHNFDDMRQSLNRSIDNFHQLAYYDRITGLPNRTTVENSLDDIIFNLRTGQYAAVLFIDIDDFKIVNDSLGHESGDNLLKLVALRLKSLLGKEETEGVYQDLELISRDVVFARIGGDEFVGLIPGLADPGKVKHIVEKLSSVFSKPFDVFGHEVYISVSVGISIFPNDASSSEQLIRHADIAMYQAKKKGKKGFQFFSSDMNKHMADRMRMEADLIQAIRNKEIVLYFQPKVPIISDHKIEFEALARWFHPELGAIRPDKFIQLAEETGHIHGLGDLILEKACQQIVKWRDSGFDDFVLSINLSPVQLNYDGAAVSIRNALKKYNIPSHFIEVEITETGLIQSEESALNQLNELRGIGVRLALDDFGTGYSSLAYLRQLPIDTLKIDKQFIQDLVKSDEAVAVLKSITTLARDLGLITVAEGVETVEQLKILEEFSCDFVQGYYYSKPLAADEVIQWLEPNQARRA